MPAATSIRMATEMAALGTAIEATTGRETTEFGVSCLSGAVEAAAALLAETVLDPVFPEDEVERERKVILHELEMLLDDPEETAWDAALGVALPGQALGRPTVGTAKSVAAITREDLVGWWSGRLPSGPHGLWPSAAASIRIGCYASPGGCSGG